MGIIVTSHPFLGILFAIYIFWTLWVLWVEGFSFSIFNFLILTLPFNNTIILPYLNISLPTLILLISAGISLMNARKFLAYLRSIRFEKIFFFELVCLFLLVFLVVLLMFRVDSNDLRGIIIVLGWAVIFLLPLRQIYRKKRLKIVFMTMALSLITITAVSLLQQLLIIPFVESINGTKRTMGSLRTVESLFGIQYRSALFGFISYGEYGIWLAAVIGMILSSIKYRLFDSRLQRMCALLVLATLLLATWTMQSRSTLLSILIILTFFIIGIHIKISRYLRHALLVLFAIVSTTLLLLFGTTGLIDTLFVSRTNTIVERLDSYELAINTFFQRPILGVGVRKFSFFSTIVESNIDVHNTILSYLVSNGILGTLPIVFITILIFIMLLQLRKKSFRSQQPFHHVSIITCSIIFIAVIIESMFFPGAHNKIIGFSLGIINAIYAFSLSPAWSKDL